MRSTGGNHRHRQVWIWLICPCCTHEVRARRTGPGRPLHIRAHLDGDGLCPCTQTDEVVVA